MKLLYTHENMIIVENAKNLIQNEGIKGILLNEYSVGGMGELAPIQTWPELWVNEADFEQAQQIMSKLIDVPEGESWVCTECSEVNEPSFELCWKCQNENS